MTHKVTDESRRMVENAAGMGMTHEDISLLLGIRDPKTLRRRYRRELDSGMPKAKLQVATKLFEKCMAGDNTAIIWWEKTRAGRSDRLTLATPDGQPLQFQEVPPEPELIGQYYERLAKIAADRAARRSSEPLGREGIPDAGGSEEPGTG